MNLKGQNHKFLVVFVAVTASLALFAAAEWQFNLINPIPRAASLPNPPISTTFRNPAAPETDIGDLEDNSYLQDVLDTIFPNGFSQLTPETISIEITRYVSTILRLQTNTGSAAKILQDGYAICGGMSVVFQALVRIAGVPVRYVGIFGLPKFGNHALAETYYDDAWHLFDPTYGLIYYSQPSYGQGVVPSLDQLRLTDKIQWTLLKVIEQPWAGSYDRAKADQWKIEPVEVDYLEAFYGFDFIGAYKNAIAVAFPISNKQPDTLYFPVDINFSSKPSYSFGKRDQNNRDVLIATAGDEAGHIGSSIIGGGGYEEIQTWFIKAPSLGYFKVVYYSAEANPPPLFATPLKALYLVSTQQVGDMTEFLFQVNDTEAVVQIRTEKDRIFWIDQWEAEWLGSEKN